MDRSVLTIGAITFIVLGVIIGISVYSQSHFEPRKQCMEHSLSLTMHIHPELKITIDGQPIIIPANVGVLPNCMQALHTHDATGKIHVEYPEQHDFKLGDFFANWGQTLAKTQLMDKTVDANDNLTMTVDGQPSSDFADLILHDGQQIDIQYQTQPN